MHEPIETFRKKDKGHLDIVKKEDNKINSIRAVK